MKNFFYILSLFYFTFGNLFTFTTEQYYVTAANSNYYPHLLNLIGSIHTNNFQNLKSIAVYDLGLTQIEKTQLNKIQKVSVVEFKTVRPDLCQFFTLPNGYRCFGWFAWKPLIIEDALKNAPYVLWVDAGTTILKPIDNLFNYLKNNNYFIVTIGNEVIDNKYRHPLKWGTSKFVREKFNLNSEVNQWILEQEFVMGGIIGVNKLGRNYFLNELCEMSKDLRFYQDDGSTPNGFGTGRQDQTLLSVLAYTKNLIIHKQDYTQNTSILLENEYNSELHITWESRFVCDKTHIYSSRGDIKNSEHYKQNIRYK